MYIKDRDKTIEELLKYIKKLTDDGMKDEKER